MNNELIKTFENANFGKIRVVVVDDEPWFVGKDATDMLGYRNSSKALNDHIDKEDKLYNDSLSSLGQRGGWLINFSGLNSLILHSNLPAAKIIQHWVTAEVMPTIYRTGSYSLQPQNNYMLQAPKTYAEALRALADETEKTEALQKQNLLLESKIEVKDQQIAEMQPKASYVDTILQSKDLVPTRLIAKDYGLSAERLNTILRDAGIQYKDGGRWYLYQKYAEMNLGQSKTFRVLGKDGEIQCKPWLCWTQSGRFFINDLLKSMNILPIVERPKQISLSEYNWGEFWS